MEGTDEKGDIDLNGIHQKVEDEGIVGSSPNRRWARKPIKGANSLYFEFIKELPQKYPTFSEDDEEDIVTDEIERIRSLHFLLFTNGVYGFESRRDVSDIDVFQYLFEEFESKYEVNRFDSLSLDTMRQFYKDSYEVRKIKAENIGEREPNPRVTDQELRELTEDTGLKTNSIIASVGRARENLQEVSLFDNGIAKYSDLPMIKSRDFEGEIQKLRDSGRFDFGVDHTDEEEEEQAAEIRDKVREVMRSMFNINISDEEDQ